MISLTNILRNFLLQFFYLTFSKTFLQIFAVLDGEHLRLQDKLHSQAVHVQPPRPRPHRRRLRRLQVQSGRKVRLFYLTLVQFREKAHTSTIMRFKVTPNQCDQMAT